MGTWPTYACEISYIYMQKCQTPFWIIKRSDNQGSTVSAMMHEKFRVIPPCYICVIITCAAHLWNCRTSWRRSTSWIPAWLEVHTPCACRQQIGLDTSQPLLFHSHWIWPNIVKQCSKYNTTNVAQLYSAENIGLFIAIC